MISSAILVYIRLLEKECPSEATKSEISINSNSKGSQKSYSYTETCYQGIGHRPKKLKYFLVAKSFTKVAEHVDASFNKILKAWKQNLFA